MSKEDIERAKDQARLQLQGIMELVAALDEGGKINGDTMTADDVRQRIDEDPLSIEVRSGWYTPGSEEHKPEEYCILLCTGGPAVRVLGRLDRGQPESATIEYQDWGTPWTEYPMDHAQEAAVVRYAQCFYYGE